MGLPGLGGCFPQAELPIFCLPFCDDWILAASLLRSPAHHDFVKMNAEPVRRRTFKKPLFQWYSMIPGTWVIRAGATGVAAPLHGPNCQARAAAREARE